MGKNNGDEYKPKTLQGFKASSLLFSMVSVYYLSRQDFTRTRPRTYVVFVYIINRIIYNYPPKRRWKVVEYWDVKRRGIYLTLWTDPERDSCFSIYQISWIKIKKQLLVNKRRHLEFLLTFQLTVFRGSFLMILLQIQWENFFLPTSKHREAKVCFFLGTCWRSCFIYRYSSFETVAKREAILNPVPKQWISKDIPSYGSQ